MPTYRELMYPTLRAVASLGGSAQGGELTDALTELLGATPEQLAITYDGRPKSVLIDRMEWARSYAKLGGALDSPQRGLYVLTSLGKSILSLPEEEGQARLAQLDRDVRAARRRRRSAGVDRNGQDRDDTGIGADATDGGAEEDTAWKEVLLARLHRLSPTGFEEFTLFLLRTYGLELTLFQRDAAAAGAERAVLVTLARFSPAARKAATVTTPTVDLIDGDKLCQLVRDKEIGLRIVLQVNEGWFDRFDA
jgi:restriction system protein